MAPSISSSQLRREARSALAPVRLRAAGVTLLCALLSILPPAAALGLAALSLWDQPFLFPAQLVLLEGLAAVCAWYMLAAGTGYVNYTLRLSRGEEAGCWCLLEGFARPGRVLAVALALLVRLLPWIILTALALWGGIWAVEWAGYWALLLLLPCGAGLLCLWVWLALRCALVPFLLVDQPGLGPFRVVERSSSWMRGRKGALLLLRLSFLGWGILSALTLGLLGLWSCPYFHTANARFYDTVQDQEEAHMPLTF